jgi:hypothetical protein
MIGEWKAVPLPVKPRLGSLRRRGNIASCRALDAEVSAESPARPAKKSALNATLGGEMAKLRELPEHAEIALAPKGGVSALKVVLVGAAVAFGGYSAVAGASMVLGRAPEGTSVAKVEFDCASSRFAWRPECQAEKAQAAALLEDDKARRTRRRSFASPAEPVVAPSAAPVSVAAAEPKAAEPTPIVAVIEKPKTGAPETTRAVERGPSPADRASLGELVRSVADRTPAADRPSAADRTSAAERTLPASSPVRQRTSERNLRFRAEPESAEPEETGSIKTVRPKVEARQRPSVARSRLARVARRNAQFASLGPDPVETRRHRRPVNGWETAEPGRRAYDDGGWRAPRRHTRLARRTEPRESYDDMTVTSERIYELPDGRLVSVRTRPRPEVVRELVAQHRAAQAAQVGGYTWGGGWNRGWGFQ